MAGARSQLERALERTDEATWREAAALAQTLGATGAFATGLRSVSAGRELAERLGLPRERPIDVALRAGRAPPEAITVEHYWQARGLRFWPGDPTRVGATDVHAEVVAARPPRPPSGSRPPTRTARSGSSSRPPGGWGLVGSTPRDEAAGHQPPLIRYFGRPASPAIAKDPGHADARLDPRSRRLYPLAETGGLSRPSDMNPLGLAASLCLCGVQ